MKDKFGINLVFHTGKGHTKPYGYTLIDYRNKRVLKGGEVMDLKELLVEPNKQAKVEHCNSIINLLLKDGTKYTMDSFKKLMLEMLCKGLHNISYANKFIMQSDLN